MATRPAILAVNYYQSRQTLGQTVNPIALRFFSDQTSGYNDLPTGYLPDDRVGDVTGVFVRVVPTQRLSPAFSNFGSGTDAIAAKQAQNVEWARGLRVSLLVNGVRVMRGPVWAFPCPPSWVQGGVTGASFGTLTVQNSGYRLMDIAHPVGQRQSLAVEIDAGSASTTDRGGSTAAEGALDFEITLQIADRKPIA